MEFASFERQPANYANDSLSAKDAADKPLIVRVTERRDSIVTKYQADGAPGVTVDVADIEANSVYVGVLWMNGAIVDALSPYVGNTVPIKLVWTEPKKGKYPFLSVEALAGAELQAAQKWAEQNDGAFEKRRTELQSEAGDENDVTALLSKLSSK